MNLSIGISPCPNDTFIFDALLHQKIDSAYSFTYHLADVEELNQRAFLGEYDITKMSYHAFSKCLDKYDLLSAGGALGNNCGPLLIAKKKLQKADLHQYKIAIPGEWTTANFLLKYYLPEVKNTQEILFSEIEEAISSGQVDAGVIIHENRFTYEERGFQLIQDLGLYWEEQTNYPIPLGGIGIKKSLPDSIKSEVNHYIQESIKYAWKNSNALPLFVTENAKEMEQEVMKKHIELYVNDFSLDLGQKGKAAVEFLCSNLAAGEPKIIT